MNQKFISPIVYQCFFYFIQVKKYIYFHSPPPPPKQRLPAYMRPTPPHFHHTAPHGMVGLPPQDSNPPLQVSSELTNSEHPWKRTGLWFLFQFRFFFKFYFETPKLSFFSNARTALEFHIQVMEFVGIPCFFSSNFSFDYNLFSKLLFSFMFYIPSGLRWNTMPYKMVLWYATEGPPGNST